MSAIRVLLADDHEPFLAVARQLLQEQHYDVVARVNNGQSVIDEASRLDPDVLLLDISMPVLDGIAVARRLRAEGFAGKIIFLTVHRDRDYVDAAVAAGAHGYIVKSRLASDLLDALKEVLAGGQFISPLQEAL